MVQSLQFCQRLEKVRTGFHSPQVLAAHPGQVTDRGAAFRESGIIHGASQHTPQPDGRSGFFFRKIFT
jgi:hypothetical protein